MTNKEVLNDYKEIYNCLQEIVENYHNIDAEERLELKLQMNFIENAYTKTYENAIKNEENLICKTEVCPNCGSLLMISDVIEFDTMCKCCDANWYGKSDK